MWVGLAVTIAVLVTGCFHPAYTWYYWLPDKSNPEVRLGNYRIELTMRDWNIKELKDKEVFDIGISLESEYLPEPPESLIIREKGGWTRFYPESILEFGDFCVKFPDPSREKVCPPLKQDSVKSLWKGFGKWNGPDAYASIDLPAADSLIEVTFTARLVDTLAHTVVKEDTWFFDLRLVKDRYWYLMK